MNVRNNFFLWHFSHTSHYIGYNFVILIETEHYYYYYTVAIRKLSILEDEKIWTFLLGFWKPEISPPNQSLTEQNAPKS